MPTATGRLRREDQFTVEPERSTVVDFAAARHARLDAPTHRFSIIDRMTAHRWAEAGGKLGYTRLAFEPAADIDGAHGGEFLLIYPRGSAWYAWGIGYDAEGFTLWHAPRGTTIGRFQTIQAALDRIHIITLAA